MDFNLSEPVYFTVDTIFDRLYFARLFLVFKSVLQCAFYFQFLAFCYFLHLVFLLLIRFLFSIARDKNVNELQKKQKTHIRNIQEI